MRKPRSDWMPYDTWYTIEYCRELAEQLRNSGKYQKVRIGSYLTEGIPARKYAKVFVLAKTEMCMVSPYHAPQEVNQK